MSYLRVLKITLVAFTALSAQWAFSLDTQENIGVSDAKYIDFIRATAKPTAQAETGNKSAVKFMSLGVNPSGEVVVTGIALGTDHGASFKPSPNAVVIAHVHNRKMSAKPEAADFDALRLLKLPSFVISADGGKIWEVAIIGGAKQYRAVLPSAVGKWVKF